jgi:glycosyltransferase involved in cell wall biosynthesis
MKVWAHTLVKNEARWLWYSVASVVNHVDKVMLWDTGSTDSTLKIIHELIVAFPGKIDFQKRQINSPSDFTSIRQEMLDMTAADWILMVDGDEIWSEESIKKVIGILDSDGKNIETIVVPTINLVGDVFHYQEESAGRYKFGDRVGHFNLRVINRNIPGIHSQGTHGVWGWADNENKMIQDRSPAKEKFIDAPYLHATFLSRGSERVDDKSVLKRAKKLKYEIGKEFPLDYYYPEVFFRDKPENISNPWLSMTSQFKFKAILETPLRKLKRKTWRGKVGY